ncbi:hypothetical protein CMUS01_14902 [Colletotrichum musicola]|uniref:Uncharacterized protein n=1 Tax=Colletotrichum musicola TaxID=2175873 RepID=A0A8H6J0L8_9PEZI|nr:hypothetical protein CMUS01_14902 [Colletotrichum musicola]
MPMDLAPVEPTSSSLFSARRWQLFMHVVQVPHIDKRREMMNPLLPLHRPCNLDRGASAARRGMGPNPRRWLAAGRPSFVPHVPSNSVPWRTPRKRHQEDTPALTGGTSECKSESQRQQRPSTDDRATRNDDTSLDLDQRLASGSAYFSRGLANEPFLALDDAVRIARRSLHIIGSHWLIPNVAPAPGPVEALSQLASHSTARPCLTWHRRRGRTWLAGRRFLGFAVAVVVPLRRSRNVTFQVVAVVVPIFSLGSRSASDEATGGPAQGRAQQ